MRRKTDGTQNFVQGDVLSFSAVDDLGSANPTYRSVTVIVQYD